MLIQSVSQYKYNNLGKTIYPQAPKIAGIFGEIIQRMKSHFFKAQPQFNQENLNVDRENGIIKGVQIVKMGANKNGSYFNPKFITDLVDGGNAQGQGVKSRFGHPNMCATSFGTFIGRYKNFTTIDGHAYADLHLDATAQKVQVPNGGVSMWEYILDMAEKNPDMFGNSIHINSETFDENVDGTVVESHIFQSLIASDLVDSPAATDGLFDKSEDLGVIVTQFFDENPNVFEAVNKNPKIIGDFFGRYSSYLNSKSLTNINMNVLDKLRKAFSTDDSFDIDLTLATGDIVTVLTEAEEPQVGDKVNDKDGKPVADGDHLLADGRTLVAKDGAIEEIKDATEPPVGDPTMKEVMQSVNSLSKEVKALATKFDSSNKVNEQAFDLIATQFNALDTKVKSIGKSIKSSYEAPGAEGTGTRNNANESAYDADKVREEREKRKNSQK